MRPPIDPLEEDGGAAEGGLDPGDEVVGVVGGSTRVFLPPSASGWLLQFTSARQGLAVVSLDLDQHDRVVDHLRLAAVGHQARRLRLGEGEGSGPPGRQGQGRRLRDVVAQALLVGGIDPAGHGIRPPKAHGVGAFVVVGAGHHESAARHAGGEQVPRLLGLGKEEADQVHRAEGDLLVPVAQPEAADEEVVVDSGRLAVVAETGEVDGSAGQRRGDDALRESGLETGNGRCGSPDGGRATAQEGRQEERPRGDRGRRRACPQVRAGGIVYHAPEPRGQAQMSESHHKGRFGLLQATALNMSNMIGIGPFITIPLLMTAMGGPQAHARLAGRPGHRRSPTAWSGASSGAAMPGSGGTLRLPARGLRPRALGPPDGVPVHLAVHPERAARDRLGLHRLRPLPAATSGPA